MIDKAKKAIRRYDMLTRGDAVLVGVSGGADSMALLYLLMDIREEYKISLKVAHLNHGFRREASEEAEFVRKSVASLGVSAVIRSIDVPAIMEEEGLSAQEAARNARYAFFQEAALEAGAKRVALAHTADDQAETVLIRLLRGAGPLGLSGIPPVRERWSGTGGQHISIIRPLIDCSRNEIEGYLACRRISFVTDSSNLKTDYLRNRVRLELLPFLEGYNPNIKETLVRTADVAHMDNHYLDMEATKSYKTVSCKDINEDIALEFKPFKALHPAISSRVLRLAVMAVKGDLKRVSFRHISDILELIDSGEGRWSLHLPDVTVSREHDKLLFKRGKGRR